MAHFDEMAYYKKEDLLNINYNKPPKTGWMDTPVDFRPGSFINPGNENSNTQT